MTNHTKDTNGLVYEPHPSIGVFNTILAEKLKHDANYETVVGEVGMTTETWDVDCLFWHYNNGLVSSLSPYLQRILLEDVWGASNDKKAKSYIRSIWKNMGSLTPFMLVPLNLILNNINEKIQYTTQTEIQSQLLKIKLAVEEEQVKGVRYINIDGQTRSNCAINKYIKGEFNLSDEDFDNEPLQMDNGDGEISDISLHTFDTLTDYQKGAFLQRKILVNIIQKGTLEQVSQALIAINSNEKWKEWQTIYNNAELTVLKYSINEVMSDAAIRDLLLNKMNQGTSYKTKFSGWEWFVADNLAFLKHKSTVDLKLLRNISKGTKSSPEKSEIKFVKEMITNWVNNYKGNNSIKPVVLSSYIALRDVLKNYNKQNDAYYQCFGVIPKLKVLSEVNFLKWYLKTITEFESHVLPGTTKLNKLHWVKDDKTGKHSAAPESWPAHCEGGMKLNSILGRVKWLLQSLRADESKLLKEQIISNIVGTSNMSTVMVHNNMMDSNGNEIDLTAPGVNEIGHMTSVANGGSDALANTKPQPKSDNRSYSRKNNQANGVA
jgi:hypothetical protein